MGNIKIQDTGYILPTNAGTQASSGNRANGGTAITLPLAEFKPIFKRNLNNNPELGLSTTSNINRGRIENAQFTLRVVLKKETSSEMNLIPALFDMVKTDGYKLLWYDYSDATAEKNTGSVLFQTASNSTFGDQLSSAEQTAFSIGSAFYTLHVLFTSITVPDTASKGTVMLELQGTIMKPETSILT